MSSRTFLFFDPETHEITGRATSESAIRASMIGSINKVDLATIAFAPEIKYDPERNQLYVCRHDPMESARVNFSEPVKKKPFFQFWGSKE